MGQQTSGEPAVIVRGDTVWSLVTQRVALTPDAIGFSDEERRLMSFADFRDACEAVAAGLLAIGLRPDAVVAWQLPTSIEALVLMVALTRIGVTQAPIIPLLREREVGHIVGQLAEHVGPVTIVIPRLFRGFDHAAMAESIAARTGSTVMISDHEDPASRENRWRLALPTGDPASLPPPPSSDTADSRRFVYSTSGTTAAPKLVCHSERSVIATTAHFEAGIAFGPTDVSTLTSPIAHVGGALTSFSGVMVGFETVLVRQFDPIDTPLLSAERGISVLRGAPPVMRAFVEAQRARPDERIFPRLRAAQGGGSARPIDVHESVKKVLGLKGATSSYGMTECPGVTACPPDDTEAHIARTSGRIVPGCRVVPVRPDGTHCAPGEEGELHVGGPMLFMGYVDTTLNAQAFDAEGLFCSGDLGIVDAEGWIRVTGRIKDIIIRNGENISAQLVEDVLSMHPDISDVGVIGLPDARTGERACAVVSLASPDRPVTLAGIGEHCTRLGLARQQHPEQLEIVDEVPRNAMGKIEKQALRERFH